MVRKRDDGRWEGRIVVGHKKNGDPIHRYVLARTQKELIVKLHDCIEMYRDADLTEDSNMTLGEWLDRWINEYMIFTIRESTLDSYKAMIKNQIKPYLGDRPLSALTTQELQKFYNTVKKKGRVKPDRLHGTELADSMVRGIHMMLHEALDKAVRLRLIVKNPTVGTTISKNNFSLCYLSIEITVISIFFCAFVGNVSFLFFVKYFNTCKINQGSEKKICCKP